MNTDKLINVLSGKEDGFFFFDNSESPNRTSLLFSDINGTIAPDNPDDITKAFSEIETVNRKGYYLAGYFNYELGYFLDTTNVPIRDIPCPLFDLGIYRSCDSFPNITCEDINTLLPPAQNTGQDYWIKNPHPNITKDEYVSSFHTLMEYIKSGDTYQVNYTFKLLFEIYGNTLALFLEMSKRQRTAYSAFIKRGTNLILSISPELFFERSVADIKIKPMKGTIARGNDPADDLRNRKALLEKEKSRAENIMIVDMERNDLGRICQTGTVCVPSIFDIEEYETLYQMTSTVQGKLREEATWHDIFKAIFPCGSVTGAPKIRTMQIINGLEPSPRGIYTGAIGYIMPNNDAVFNIPIRTIQHDLVSSKASFGTGSGIVSDSNAQAEYDECMLKAKCFTDLSRDYQLIETIRWDQQNGYFLLRYHIDRLEESAKFFNITFLRSNIIEEMSKLTAHFDNHKHYRVRLLLYANGNMSLSYTTIEATVRSSIKIRLANIRINSKNIFLYHKTTNRELYDSLLRSNKSKGYADIIFTNERGEITEGTISNIFLKQGETFFTPPVSCGLLNGTYRQYLLESNPETYKEKVLCVSDLIKADGIYICNSVREIYKVNLSGHEQISAGRSYEQAFNT